MAQDLLVFNGIDGSTGDYLVPPMLPDVFARIARGGRVERRHLSELRWRAEELKEHKYALPSDRDPKNLAEAGWGLILPAAADPKTTDAILEALAPLRDLRRGQAKGLYKEF